MAVAQEEALEALLVHFPRPGSPGSQVQENQPEQVLQEVALARPAVVQLEAVAVTKLCLLRFVPFCCSLLLVRAPGPGVPRSLCAHEVGPCAGAQR